MKQQIFAVCFEKFGNLIPAKIALLFYKIWKVQRKYCSNKTIFFQK